MDIANWLIYIDKLMMNVQMEMNSGDREENLTHAGAKSASFSGSF